MKEMNNAVLLEQANTLIFHRTTSGVIIKTYKLFNEMFTLTCRKRYRQCVTQASCLLLANRGPGRAGTHDCVGEMMRTGSDSNLKTCYDEESSASWHLLPLCLICTVLADVWVTTFPDAVAFNNCIVGGAESREQ